MSDEATIQTDVTIQTVLGAITRLQPAVDAIVAAAARAASSDSDPMPPEIAAAVDDVLRAAGIPDPARLAPPERATVAAFVRSTFGQAGDLLHRPSRAAGWTHSDIAVLEGQGRGSMMVPTFIEQSGFAGEVRSFLDVGTGVGWLAVGATQVWPECTVVGLDTWEPSLERARANVAASGVADRVELRHQSVADLDERDRFDLTWVPIFFIPLDVAATGFERILTATRPGGRIVVGRYDPPSDPLASATQRMRTVRDGGSWVEVHEVVDLLVAAGWTDPRPVPHGGPPGLDFVGAERH